jgi:hypothetical protein
MLAAQLQQLTPRMRSSARSFKSTATLLRKKLGEVLEELH